MKELYEKRKRIMSIRETIENEKQSEKNRRQKRENKTYRNIKIFRQRGIHMQIAKVSGQIGRKKIDSEVQREADR